MKDFFIYCYELINENREWLFSGAGISVITVLIFFFRNLKKKQPVPNTSTYNVTYHNLKTNENESQLEANPVIQLVERFKLVYLSHGIAINQIPAFIGEHFMLKISDFKDNESILNILNEDILQWTCDVFGINRGWLDGTEERIYKHRNFYKSVHSLIQLLSELRKEYEDIEVYMIKNGELDPQKYGKHYVIVIFKYQINTLNKKPIYSYIPVSTNWDWGYWRSRYQLKSIIYFCQRFNIYIHGYDMETEVLTELSGGTLFPEVELDKLKVGYSWYPEDFVDLPSESIEAKEIEETIKIREYIKSEGYEKYYQKVIHSLHDREYL